MCSPPTKTWDGVAFKEKKSSAFSEFDVLETIPITKDGGVVKEITKYGVEDDGPQKGQTVEVHYTGKLEDGTKFDSSRDRNSMFSFTLGEGKVIKAWDFGVASMKRGERAVITCTSDYGYGDKGSPPNIPGGATLLFDVELFDWSYEKVTPDGMITKLELNEGTGWRKPNDYATITVTYTGRIQGGAVFSQEQHRTIMIGEDDEVPSGFMTACKHMKKGSKAIFYIKPSTHHFEPELMPDGITASDAFEYEIEMVDFERAKKNYEMDAKEKIEFGLKCKARGNQLFKRGRLFDAEKRYELIISTLESLDADATNEEKQECKDLQCAAWSNLAAVQLKEEKFDDVQINCTKVLGVNKKNAKALFRRSQARYKLDDYDGAFKDVKKSVKLKPNDKAIRGHFTTCKTAVSKHQEKQEKMYRHVFKRSSLYRDQADPKPQSYRPHHKQRRHRYERSEHNNRNRNGGGEGGGGDKNEKDEKDVNDGSGEVVADEVMSDEVVSDKVMSDKAVPAEVVPAEVAPAEVAPVEVVPDVNVNDVQDTELAEQPAEA